MSIEAENIEHEVEIESDNEQIIKRLDAIIFLLEIIANIDNGATKELIGD